MALTKITSNVVKDDAVTSAKIVDGGIATADIAANAVTSAKIAQNSILTKHIDDGQVTTDQLGADAVTSAKIADDAISEEHLDVTVITSLTEVTAATGDLLMIADISDSNNLKKIPVSSILAGTHTGAINTSGTISSGAISTSSSVAVTGAAGAAISEGLLVDWSTNLARFLTYDSSTGSEIAFYTQPSGGSTTQALRIDSSQNSTFAGTISSGAITSSGDITLADNLKATGNNLKLHAGGNHIINIDLNGNLYPQTHNAVDLGFSDSLAFRNLHLAGAITGGATISSGAITVTSTGAGTTASTFSGNYSSSGDVKLASFERSGGAVAAAIEYNDATTDMELGTTTSHAFSLKTADTRRLTISSAGVVEVGTLTSGQTGTMKINNEGGNTATLEVLSRTNRSILRIADNDTNGYISAEDGIFSIGRNTGNNSANININSSNLVGIGTNNPTTLLHIKGAGDAIRVESTNAGAGGAQVDLLHFTASPADNDTHASINFGGYTSGTSSAYGSAIRSVWSNVGGKEAQLEFYTRDDSDFAARMVIDKDGQVEVKSSNIYLTGSNDRRIKLSDSGIAGISDSNNTVHIRGDNDFMKLNAAGNGGFIFEENGDEHLRIAANGYTTFKHSGNDFGIQIRSEGSSRSGLVIDHPGTTTIMGSALVLASDNSYRLGTASYYHVRMMQDGNTYIGNSGTTHFTSDGALRITAAAGYNQLRLESNATDNTNKTSGITSLMYTNNTVSFFQGFFQNGSNAVYYGSADGAHRGMQRHYFYVNDNYNATSGHKLVMTLASSSGTALVVNGNNSTGGTVNWIADSNKGSTESHCHYGSNGDWYIRPANVASGDVNVRNYAAESDERLKTNIVDITYGTTELLQLRPRKFEWKEGAGERNGFIAQEVESVIPAFVKTGEMKIDGHEEEDGIKTVDYNSIVATLVKTVQELEARIKTLEG